MPGRNRTGPMGMGPMTGRGAGPCAGYAAEGRPYPRRGWGCGMGYAWGRGFGGAGGRQAGALRRGGWMRFGGYDTPYGYPEGYAPADPTLEKQALSSQAKALQAELDWIHKRLAEMDTKPAPDEQ